MFVAVSLHDAAWQPHTSPTLGWLTAAASAESSGAHLARPPNHHIALDHAHRCAAAATSIHAHHHYTAN